MVIETETQFRFRSSPPEQPICSAVFLGLKTRIIGSCFSFSIKKARHGVGKV
jgi:hypothetical protein